ncbi:MAG: hypothetical protein AB7O45_13985 [Alphaproteobacteria bacterium]
MTLRSLAVLAVLAAVPTLAAERHAAERHADWPLLPETFPSTGGNGVVIGEYRPRVVGDKCTTAFTATLPDGAVYRNVVEFETEAVEGGILCKNGKWRAADGSASGTTPLRVFIKDGVVRGKP